MEDNKKNKNKVEKELENKSNENEEYKNYTKESIEYAMGIDIPLRGMINKY